MYDELQIFSRMPDGYVVLSIHRFFKFLFETFKALSSDSPSLILIMIITLKYLLSLFKDCKGRT